MVNFAGVSTGGNVPPQNYQNIPVHTGGGMNSQNPLSPGQGFAPNYPVQEQKKSSKIWWILPILLLLFLGVAGAGGGLFLWYQANSGATVDNVNKAPTATATAAKTPTPAPSTSPTSEGGGK